MQIPAETLLGSLPPVWQEDLLPLIRARVAAAGTKIVVLDDDPTGTQTVHDVAVLTDWTVASLTQALTEPEPLIYILTNSRSMPLTHAQIISHVAAQNLRAAQSATGRQIAVISRSDSTLRGHYPGEVEPLIRELGARIDGTLIIPFFFEGGRLTIADTHYVCEGELLVPASETEYARDPTFGYRHSDLRAWVAEKHRGRVAAADVISVSLEDLRLGGPGAVAARLEPLTGGRIGIVNAASYRDLEVAVIALLDAEAAGKRFLYRTAASFVRVRAGIGPTPLLTSQQLGGGAGGGLVVVGSRIGRTTQQLSLACATPGVRCIELSAPALLDQEQRVPAIRLAAERLDEGLAAGEHVLVYTSRDNVWGNFGRTALQVGQSISEALVNVVTRLQNRPAWIIAKGGITSSDIATMALGIRRALVLGQAIPGIPIWRTGPESRWPGLTYVVFPGNVGEPDTLVRMIDILGGRPDPAGEDSLTL